MNFQAVRSHNDAYELAWQIAQGGRFTANTITFEPVGDGATVICHRPDNPNPRYVSCELADFVIWPNRREINDWLHRMRTEQAEQRKRLETQGHCCECPHDLFPLNCNCFCHRFAALTTPPN